MNPVLPPLLLGLAVVLGWEGLVAGDFLNGALFPPPRQILETLSSERALFQTATFETATASVLGFLIALVLGALLAFLLAARPWLRRAVLPYAVFFQTVPIIAVAPLMVIYLGFGMGTVIAASVLVAVFPVLAGGLIGLSSVDEQELELFRLYGARPGQVLWHLRLPRSYAAFYSGAKVAAGLAVIGAVAGEFVAGGGLGGVIDAARTQQRTDLVFGALLLLSAIGLSLIGFLRSVHRVLHLWRPIARHLQD